MEDTGKIFGPAQAAVAKAIADSAEEGIIPAAKLDEWVIIVQRFHSSKSNRLPQNLPIQLWRNKNGATTCTQEVSNTGKNQLTTKTVQNTQSWASKFHAYGDHHTYKSHLTHPHLKAQRKSSKHLPGSDRIILEVGTPFIKRYGTRGINELRQIAKDKFMIADLKTLDVGKVEVDIAYEDTADAVVAAGLAPAETLTQQYRKPNA